MAKIIGESGRYVSDEAARRKRQIIVKVCVFIGLLGVIEGIIISTLFPLSWLTPVGKASIVLAAAVGMWILDKWSDRELKTVEKQKDNYLRGAAGEILVGELLRKLPDGYYVINDLATPSGNLDHVVVGLTGVFVLDTKAWRGVVAADGKGELLRNGKPTDKREVSQLVGRMMGVREKVCTMLPGMDVRFEAVLVFTAAWVEARWGKTGHANCITDDKLCTYITDKNCGRKLRPHEVSQIARALHLLAQADEDCERETKPQIRNGRPGLQLVIAD